MTFDRPWGSLWVAALVVASAPSLLARIHRHDSIHCTKHDAGRGVFLLRLEGIPPDLLPPCKQLCRALLWTGNVRGTCIAGCSPALASKVPCIQGDCSGPPPASKLERISKSRPNAPAIDYDLSAFRDGQCLFTHGYTMGTAAGNLWLHNLFMLHSENGDGPDASISVTTAYVTRTSMEQEGGPAFSTAQLYLDGALISVRATNFQTNRYCSLCKKSQVLLEKMRFLEARVLNLRFFAIVYNATVELLQKRSPRLCWERSSFLSTVLFVWRLPCL
jgi:hypothetical protein